MSELRRQMAAAKQIIAAHEGPVLLSGDFNTWRGARMNLIDEIAGDLGFSHHSHLTNTLKKHYGRTPLQIRRDRV